MIKIQGGRRGQLGRRKVGAIRGEIAAARQREIDAIEHEITSALAPERDDRETKLARELESYRAARDAQIQARKKRIEETVGPRPLLPVHINYEERAARNIQVRPFAYSVGVPCPSLRPASCRPAGINSSGKDFCY